MRRKRKRASDMRAEQIERWLQRSVLALALYVWLGGFAVLADTSIEGQASMSEGGGVRLGYPIPLNSWLHLDLGASAWLGERTTVAFEAIPMARWTSSNWYAEAGLGGAALFNADPARTGSSLLFTEALGIGYKGSRWEATVHYRHYSNAGLASPNSGYDFVGAGVRFEF